MWDTAPSFSLQFRADISATCQRNYPTPKIFKHEQLSSKARSATLRHVFQSLLAINAILRCVFNSLPAIITILLCVCDTMTAQKCIF